MNYGVAVHAVPASGGDRTPTTNPPEATFITFIVPGIPVPWARAGGGTTTHRFTPQKQRSYMGAVKLFAASAMKGAPPLCGPLRLDIDAAYPWPASWSAKRRAGCAARWKTSRPDAGNVSKLVEDALNGIVWGDDAQVCACVVRKFYDEMPCLRVKIGRLG